MYFGPLAFLCLDLLFDWSLRVCKKSGFRKWAFIYLFIKKPQDNFHLLFIFGNYNLFVFHVNFNAYRFS